MAPATAQLDVAPISADLSLKDRIYDSLKQAITAMDIYADDANLHKKFGSFFFWLVLQRTTFQLIFQGLIL